MKVKKKKKTKKSFFVCCYNTMHTADSIKHFNTLMASEIFFYFF